MEQGFGTFGGTSARADRPTYMQATQLELPLKGRHGGARPKAGRKRVSERKRTFVAHRSREGVKRYEPLLLTLKLVQGLPTLRGEPLGRAVMDALERLESPEQYAVRTGRPVEDLLDDYNVGERVWGAGS